MALSTVIKHLYDGSLTLSDGTGTPVTLVVLYCTGDLSISGMAETQKNVVAYETRGTLNSVRHTSRTYITGSFTVHVADYSDATDGTLLDFVLKQNSYSANVSTLGANAEVYAVDLLWTIEGTDHGDAADHTETMTDVHLTVDSTEGEPNTLSFNYTCYGTSTWT